MNFKIFYQMIIKTIRILTFDLDSFSYCFLYVLTFFKEIQYFLEKSSVVSDFSPS
jgi:hypothetical protein